MHAAGPVVDPLPCSGCNRLLDPLRAGHVAIFDNRLHYFCNATSCRAAFLSPWGKVAEPSPSPKTAVDRISVRLDEAREARAAASEKSAPIANAHGAVVPEDDLPEPLRLDDDRGLVEPIERIIASHEPPRPDAAEPRDVGGLLLLLGVVAGTLAVLLGLTTGGRLVLLSRVILAGVGASMLVARAFTTPRNPADPHPLPIIAGPIASLGVAVWTIFRGPPALGGEAVTLAGAIATVAAVGAWLLESSRRSVEAERAWIENAMTVPGRRLPNEGGPPEEGVFDIRAGERILVEEGEDVPVDIVISEGEAEVLPWLGALTPVRRRVGDPVVAGAHIWKGRVVGTCTWSGPDRVFSRLVLDPRRRVDALVPVAQAARSLVERWAAIAAVASGALSYAITGSAIDAALTAVAVQAGLATSIIGTLGGVSVARGLMAAQRRGVTYKSADAWDRAAHTSVAIFCARGTLLLGEPEVAEIESLSKNLDAADILSLAAGAARADSSPTAQAILRAAKTRGNKPNAVRNPTVALGLGVVAVTSSGEELCVGSRAHLVEQRVSIASAEWRMGELEALGRSVVLVALGGRLVGVVALQDGIRPGARAAVQHLLDAQVEPVLMSGDSRETCDAIARSLDIEHVRAEVLPQDRAEEVKRVSESGESVAVLGHTPLDDAALAAADVSVALAAAGAATSEHDIDLASDDLRDAAVAIALAKRTRVEARVGFGLAAMPPVLGVVVVALGILPPVFVPIAAFLGGVVGVVHGRALERSKPLG
ncbi:MAG: HAD-IC family P-type ATPase [Polyangiaceae bacterium]|nr:HAD-IC family P-type ATPase [Polyangiaceae bacterium]